MNKLFTLLSLAAVFGSVHGAYTAQPTAGSITNTGVTIAVTPTNDVAVKCGVFADGATAPTAAEVYAGTGTGDAAVGTTNGPVVAVITIAKGGAGTEINGAVTGLTKNLPYDIYCATDDTTKLLSNKVDFTTTNVGYGAQPTAGSITLTGVTITVTPNDNKDVKCGVFAEGVTAPTADQVWANTGTGNAAQGVANGPIVNVIAITKGGAGTEISGPVTGLTKNTAYDIYCATDDGTKVLSDKVDFTTLNDGYSAQPTAGSITNTGVTIAVASGANVDIKCGVFAEDATAPTAAQVWANTGTGGAVQGAANGPVVDVITIAKNGATVSVNGAVTGLTKNTAYDIYCATEDTTKLLSNKVDFTTTNVGYGAQPTAGSITTTGVTIAVTPNSNVDTKCGVFADGATAPTADQVYANTGTGDAAVGTTNGPIVAVVTAAKNGAGVSVNAAVTGLTANTAYDIYCATNDGTKVLSDKVDFTTTKVVAADPTFSPASGNVTTGSALTLTSANAATICLRSDTTAPTCDADGTCGTGSTAYNATAKPTITAAITWKAIGCAGTGKTDSAVVTAAYDAVAATTTAAPAAATTTVSGASSEAAWSTMLTVFAIAMAAFSTL